MFLAPRGNIAINLFGFKIRDIVITVITRVETGLLGRLSGFLFDVFDQWFDLLLVVGLLSHVGAHNDLSMLI